MEDLSPPGTDEKPCGSRDAINHDATAALAKSCVATAYYDGFCDGIMRQPWEAAADYAAVMGQAYAKTGERPEPFLPVTGPGPDEWPMSDGMVALIEALEPFAAMWVFSKDRPDARVRCATENGVLELPVADFTRAFEVWSRAGGHAIRDGGAS
tara:strand:+ start:1007 stop:1468 length:462 start_codon:yes stop_codon:yes gene_type:complete